MRVFNSNGTSSRQLYKPDSGPTATSKSDNYTIKDEFNAVIQGMCGVYDISEELVNQLLKE